MRAADVRAREDNNEDSLVAPKLTRAKARELVELGAFEWPTTPLKQPAVMPVPTVLLEARY